MFIFSIIIGFSFIFLASYSIFDRKNFEYLFITLFCIGSPIPIFAYTQVWLIKPYLYFSFAIYFFITCYKFSKIIYNNRSFTIPSRFIYCIDDIKNKLSNNWKIILISFAFTSFFTYKMFPPIWRFEAHDLLYYSWLNEVFIIDYQGPVKIPTAFPSLLSANHLMSGSLLTPFLLINNNINIYYSHCIKYILVFLTFFNFNFLYIKSFLKKFNFKYNLLLLPLFILSLLFFLYHPELDYSLGISNYPLILIILSTSSTLIKYSDRSQEKNNKRELLRLLIFYGYGLLISKATTFPIVFISLIIFSLSLGIKNLKNLKNSFINLEKKFIALILVMVIMNISSWIIAKSNHGSLQISPPLCLVGNFDMNGTLKCLSSAFSNPFSGWNISSYKIDFLKNSGFNSFIHDFYFIWIVCIIPSFCSGIFLIKNTKFASFKYFGKYIVSYNLATSLGIVFIRESLNYSGAHTFHSAVISPLFFVTSILMLYKEKSEKLDLNKIARTILISLIFLMIIINNYDNSIILRRAKSIKNSSFKIEPPVSITINESKYFDDSFCTENLNIIEKFGLFLNKSGCANYDIGEIKAALEGKRTNISNLSESSVIKQWALEENLK